MLDKAERKFEGKTNPLMTDFKDLEKQGPTEISQPKPALEIETP